MNQLEAMRQGGQVLGQIRDSLVLWTNVGTSFAEIEAEAQRQIKAAGMKPSFSTVPGYHWATCIMKNAALCHGIPNETVVADGDIITIDLGLINQGYHLDTTVTFGVGSITGEQQQFLEIGKAALRKAIARAKTGNTVYDIGSTIEKYLVKHECSAVYQLTGHGIGTELHMEPNIPCVGIGSDQLITLTKDQTIAVEVMYTAGEPHVTLAKDGWTYTTADGSLSGMFEETVLVTDRGGVVLTSGKTTK